MNEWRKDAACRGLPYETFGREYVRNSRKGRDEWVYPHEEEAKAICTTCPVVEQCLEWALPMGDEAILGGLTRKERIRLAAFRGVCYPIGSEKPHGTDRRYFQHRKDGEVPVRDFCPDCADAHSRVTTDNDIKRRPRVPSAQSRMKIW